MARRPWNGRRWFQRRAARTYTAATNPDNIARGIAVISGAAILLADPASQMHSAWVNNPEGRRGPEMARVGVLELSKIKPARYFAAMLPSVAVEGAIATRKVVKKVPKWFGM